MRTTQIGKCPPKRERAQQGTCVNSGEGRAKRRLGRVFWSTIGRFITIPLALLIAAAVSGFVLVSLGLERITGSLQGEQSGNDFVVVMFDLMGQGILLATGLTLIPALLVVIVGEIARIRAAIYYVVGGGLALAAMPMLARMSESGNIVVPETTVLQVFATAGFAGGFIYWLIAGRNA